jgi:hypothetical protein
MPSFDYLVIKPKPFDFGDGELRVLEAGSRIPGEVAESWGSGRAVDHLTNQGILAPVPRDDAANADWEFGRPSDSVEDEPKAATFPQHVVAAKFVLSDGTEVQGKAAALEAQAALDEAAEGELNA